MPGPEDFFLNCGASIARDLVWGAIREARYCCCFNDFVKDLKKEKNELLKNKKSVDEDVKRAKKETRKIHNDDKDWLEEADKLEEQVEKLEAKVEKYKSCCLGRCPNWICRYLLGRQLKIKKDNFKLHCDKRPKDRIESLATLQGMEYFSSKDFMRFKSRELAHQQLMEAIQDDGVSMIGLYGMGGSGKTTLAKEVGKEAEQLFNYKVVFVVVSREGVRRIQDKIASSLELELNEKEEIDRAKRLSMRLRNNDERFLIIVDDVWEKLDFEAIGIPFGENRKGCKVLMTTRPISVCNLMDCQKTIPLSILSFEESWDLFQKHAQFSDETSNALKDLAKKITEKCDGLPVAIAAVASTLKGKTQVEWEVALKDLKDSRPMDIEEGLRNPYTCLELSYNNLQSREAKSLFLLCSIFSEDWEIDCHYLFIFGIGLGLFGRVGSYAMARKQASVAKSKLINSCLLLEAKDDEGFECVKMHDLVHDVALLLAKKENKAIMRIQKEENYLEEDSITEGTQIKYLWCDKFPNKLDYTELELVIFCSDSESVRVPCEFFERKKKLRIMVLVNDGSEKVLRLPDSIQTLINLRCLGLTGWELGDISFLGNLKGLESLILQKCTFHELPNAILQLTKLSILNVTECQIAKDPCDVIGKCSQLEDLYFTKNKGFDWKFDNEIATEFLDKFNLPKRLQNYSLQIGEMMREFDTAKGCISRSLVIEYFDASTSNATIKDLVKKTECLSLGHIKGGCKNIIPDIIGGGMTELIELVLHDSEEIESLIDTTNLECQVGTLFSKLSNLWIERMKHLVTLCRALPYPAIFEKLEKLCVYECNQLHGVLFVGKLDLCNLKVLELWHCPKLTSLFTLDSVQSLLQLQYLKIEECSELKHIISEEMEEEIIEDDNDQRTDQLPFQKLKHIIVRSCIQLKYTIPVSYARGLVQLESMEIAAVDELKFLFGQYSHANQLADAAENDFLAKLPVLKRLELSGLPNIVSIFPENYYPVWPSLQELHLNNCPQFSIMSLNKCAVGSQVKQHCGPTKDLIEQSYKSLVKLEINGLERIKSVFSACSMKSMPQLEELRIVGCDQLEQIIASEEHHNIMNSGTESCPKSTSNCCTLHPGSLDLCPLKWVYLTDCPMLRSLFTLSIARTLTSLERLEVSNCHSLKEIIQNDSDLQSHDSVFPKLKDLDIDDCNSLECIFLVSFAQGLMELERISILDAPQLQYLFGEGSLEHHSSHQYQNIIQFELPVLEDLRLEKLPNLISICPNNYHAVCSSLQKIRLDHVGLSNSTTNSSKGGSEDRHWGCTFTKDLNELSYKSLVELEINGLEGIKSIFSACSMKSMPQLEELRIVGCHQLEQIIASEEHHNIMNNGSLDLCPLKWMYLTDCPMLRSLFTLSIARTLTSLERLEVSNCHSLKEIIQNDSDLQSHDSVFPKLKDLDIDDCNSLECIFLVSFAQGLMELERINILDAPQLQYLFGEGSLEHHSSHQYQNIIQFELPVLEDLRLKKLPNLISICPNNYHAVCSSLQKIRLDHVGLSNSTTNSSKGGSEDRHWGCTFTKDLNELSYKSLVELEINGLEGIKSIFSACSMKSMPQLEELRIVGCHQLEQIIASEEHHNIMNNGSLDLCPLKWVYLTDCPMLRSLFTLSIARTLTSLERLEVSNCHSLKEIIQNDSDLQSHDSVFPKLKDLDIDDCNSLECIFLVSFAQGLMELERINILDAPQLQYLFGEGSLEHHSSHQYQNIIQFELPVLEDLRLKKLPNLISICPNNYHAVCSSLQKIRLDHVGLSNSTTNNSMGGSEDRHWGCTSTVDLRATIMKLVQNSEEHIIEKENDLLLLREMVLQNQHEIMYLCISPKRLLNLQNLLELRVEGCGKLKAMFSVSVLRSLPQLKALLMIECEELEQITIEDKENENLSNPYSQNGCFPQLEVLIIKCCNKLKRLFSISTSREFPKLEYLIIKEASQLEEVFESEKCETEERKEVVLSELKYIFLVQLPILTHVWLRIPTVTCCVVQNCPKLFLTIAPQKSFEELSTEMFDNLYHHHEDLSWELGNILSKIMKETYDKDPMLKSEVSDFGDEAASCSEPPSAQIIKEKGKEIVGNGSALKAPAIATSSIDVHELMDEQSISEPTLLGQQLALGEPKLTTEVPQEIISSHQCVEAIPRETAKESPTSKEAVIATLSDDIALQIGPLRKVSAQSVTEEVQQDLPIKKADTMISLTDLEPGSFTSLHKSSPQDIEAVVKESSQQGPSFEEATIATLSSDLAPRNSLPAGSLAIGPLQKTSHLGVVDGIHEGLPIEKAKTVALSSKIILTEQQATEGNEITNNSANSLLDPGQNEPKLKISSLCPPIALSDKTFSQISSNSAISPSSSTSAILLAELCTKSGIDKFSASTEFLGSRLILEPGRFQELKTKLTQYFNMPLEAIFETNTLDDVESIVNSLAMGTTDVIQENILEDLKSRLIQFKECVPKAISTMQSSLGFMSNYESLNVELNTKLSEGQENLGDLECKISETHAKEYAIDMEIQQLFAQKMEILEQRKSLASQLNQSTEAVSKDYVKWKAMGKKLKVSTENWLKSREDLAHANATWKLFKESVGL